MSPAVNVVYVNRSRADALGGFFGGITRAVVSSRQRDGTVNELRALKGRLEASWREAPENRQIQRQVTDSARNRASISTSRAVR